MAKSSRKRVKPKPLGRKGKKKISPLNSEKIDYVDYKDVDLLKRFMSDRAKIRSRRVTGNDVQQQREVATAIKNAREMGLLAYTSRVTTQRRGGRRDDRRDDRKGRREGPEAEAPETKEVEGTDAEVTETVETPVEA